MESTIDEEVATGMAVKVVHHALDTNSKQYQDNWDKIFGKTKGCPVKEYVEDVKKSKLDNVEFPQRKNINTRSK